MKKGVERLYRFTCWVCPERCQAKLHARGGGPLTVRLRVNYVDGL